MLFCFYAVAVVTVGTGIVLLGFVYLIVFGSIISITIIVLLVVSAHL
jgi:hypothetical protein